VHVVSICSPNYLHDSHIRLALRSGADAICEKPLVINPWNLDALQDLERESGRRVYTVLQLRLHPQLIALRERLRAAQGVKHDVCLTYCTSRGRWYDMSWKGSEERSGGLVTNIGIHLFDLVLWLFGDVIRSEVHFRTEHRVSGFVELDRARVRWFLSTDIGDLPFVPEPGVRTTFRSITVDGEEIEFSDGFADLHTRVYEEVLAGRGFGIEDGRPAISLTHLIRQTPATEPRAPVHPKLEGHFV
jgi:UDP-N-acetyl-2-amino-2-deoxyglucuronate dehydrogenase